MRPLLVRFFQSAAILAALPLIVLLAGPASAKDVVAPAAVEGLLVTRDDTHVELSWNAVTHETTGGPETLDHYNIYKGTTPDFVPDKAGATNLHGTSLTESFTDTGTAQDGIDAYYLVSAVDAAGNESQTKPSLVETPPVLGGFWTNMTIELNWTAAEPAGDVVSYRVYYGKASGKYEFVEDVGLDTSVSLSGLEVFINWYAAVTAVDANGNESAFSNEHIDAVRGIVKLRVHDGEELCWGDGQCTPTDPEKIQRNGGFQILVPATFPEGDWVSVEVTFTLDSRLCVPPAQGTVNKCAGGPNPCVDPPCSGDGPFNPCGDPWDRLAQLFLVLDDCIETGGSCKTTNNLELVHAVTPFGSDAEAPDGSGQVPPRSLTLDITPYAPLLTGTKYLGAEIVHYVQKGWWVTVDFTFSKRPDQVSPKPPAAGIEVIGLGGASLTREITIPAGATQVVGRLFTTGHGSDEFSPHTGQVLVDESPVWTDMIWRTDCSKFGVNNCVPGSCKDWNACGCPSCTYPRSGWCPGYIACHDNAPCDQDIDLTPFLTPGTHDVGFQILNVGGSWSNSLVVFWY